MTTRRQFLAQSAALASTLSLNRGLHAQTSKPLRILILGGTGFIGPHMVHRAQARGHSVTLFNRGRTNSDLFPDVEKLVGDRDGQLEALEKDENRLFKAECVNHDENRRGGPKAIGSDADSPRATLT